MSEDQKKALEQQLWNIANTLRGKMNADEFRDYILGFIFYKYLSEKMDIYANSILKQDHIKYRDIRDSTEAIYGISSGKEYIEAIKEESLEKLGYFLKPSELFSEIAKRGNGNGNGSTDAQLGVSTDNNFILEDLQKILINIQLSTMGTASEEDFDNLFEDMDLNSTKLGKTPEARNEIIAKVLSHLDKIDFQLEDSRIASQQDLLGDAYEYLIGQFASGAGKKAGEFYTPQQVSMVLAKIVTTGKSKLKSVYDPTCGSGSLLLRVAKEVKEVNNFYGQEMNRTTYNLARMNMILHGVHYLKFDIKQEDTLEHPQHLEKQFEAVVANPPFSAQWSANPLFTSDDRFSQYGKLAPSGKADFAFVQHMVYHLAENGIMAVVLPHGALFRGGAEQHIRKYLIEDKNYLDAVIGLPANIFYGTSIPTCIMVFKKCRENPEDVLFIDASNDFDKVKTQNILREEHIDKIISTYRNRTETPKYSKRAFIRTDAQFGRLPVDAQFGRLPGEAQSGPLDTIESNDYNLNIPRYVDTFEAETSIDIEKLAGELVGLETQMKDTDKAIAGFCKELNIPTPF
jgi:type I restriction enzyme M protein